MLTMTEKPKTLFPMATPEDFKQASERAMNLWIGALSPMWVPFMAASAFGMSAYVAGKTLQKDLVGDLPLAPRWPGFAPMWGQMGVAPDFTPQAFEQAIVDAAQAVEDVVAPVEAAMETMVKATMSTFTDATADVAGDTEVVAHAVTEAAAETVVAPEVLPVEVAPVETVAAPVLAEPVVTKPVAPKAIAKDLAVAKPATKSTPKPTAKPKAQPKA